MTTTKQPTKRRSRYRQDRKNAPTMRFQPRDRAIIQAVAKYRYVTTAGLLKLFAPEGRGERAVRRRLMILFHNRYLKRHFLFPLDRPPEIGSTQAIYVLDKEAARKLWGSEWWRTSEGKKLVRRRKVGYHHLKHSLAVAQFQLTLDLAIGRSRGMVLDRFTADMEDKGMRIRVPIPRYRVTRRGVERKGGIERLTVWPDASFQLRSKKRSWYYFLELDLSTRKTERLFKRFLAYWQYTVRDKEHLLNERGVEGAFVLFVAEDKKQRNLLIEIANRVPEIRRRRPYFWFLKQDALSFEDPRPLTAEPILRGLDGKPGFLTKP